MLDAYFSILLWLLLELVIHSRIVTTTSSHLVHHLILSNWPHLIIRLLITHHRLILLELRAHHRLTLLELGAPHRLVLLELRAHHGLILLELGAPHRLVLLVLGGKSEFCIEFHIRLLSPFHFLTFIRINKCLRIRVDHQIGL